MENNVKSHVARLLGLFKDCKYTCAVFTFAFVSISIGEALSLACFASKQTPKVGPNLVLSTILQSVALRTLQDKCLLAFGNVSRHGFSEEEKKQT